MPKHSDTGYAFNLSNTDTAGIQAGTHALQIAFIAIFDDDFGGKYAYTMRKELWGPDLKQHRSLREFEFTEPALVGREY